MGPVTSEKTLIDLRDEMYRDNVRSVAGNRESRPTIFSQSVLFREPRLIYLFVISLFISFISYFIHVQEIELKLTRH